MKRKNQGSYGENEKHQQLFYSVDTILYSRAALTYLLYSVYGVFENARLAGSYIDTSAKEKKKTANCSQQKARELTRE